MKILVQVILFVLIILFLTKIVSMNVIHYSALAENVANGVTYILYSGLFSPIIWIVLVLVGLLYLVRNNVAFRFMVLLVFLWPMVIVLNFLTHGYVVGDQPRDEFALSSLMVSGRVTFSQASSISGYFNWPSAWLLEGIFSNVINVSPFTAPVYLMVVTYLLLGLSLVVMSSRLLPHHEYGLAMVSMLAYAILNPYKILHFCPQIYALTLLVLFLAILFKRSLTMESFILVFIISMAIITSHPLTSIVVVGITGLILIFNLVKKEKELRGSFILGAVILIFLIFIMWNLRYEALLGSVLMELKKPEIQSLRSISEINIYSFNLFFKLMSLYRYVSFIILIVGSLLAVVVLLRRKSPLRMRVFAIGMGIIAGSALLNFIPGSFFSRLLYFIGAFISGLFPLAILSVKERLRNGVFLKITLPVVIILAPTLSHVALLEFLTNNNPVAAITGPYETSASIFIAKHYNFGGCIGIPSGALGFYTYTINSNLSKPLCTYLLSDIAPSVSIHPTDNLSASIFVKSVYVGNIFEVSPRERFNYYMRTLINSFELVDYYLNVNYDLIYNNEVFKIYNAFKQR